MGTGPPARDDAHYVVGHDEHEQNRLMEQARRFRPLTENLFRRAGLRPGMKVLDIGCGVGDVAFLAAELVGPTGSVLGIDAEERAIETAKRRAAELHFGNVSFVQGDFRKHGWSDEFDAAVGRLVLMYQGDPVAALEAVRAALKGGGIAIFQEMDFARLPFMYPQVPLYERCAEWAFAALRRSGAHMDMGSRLSEYYQQAGFPRPQLTYEAYVGYEECADMVADIVRSALPGIVRFGIASAEEVQIDTLHERLRGAVKGSVLTSPTLIGAWSAKRLVAQEKSG
jgi:ubiquinone/menaquinone biosynthesis C-methylase UbiE